MHFSKRVLLLCSSLFLVLASVGYSNAAEPEILRLWEGDAPQAGGTDAKDIPTIHLYRVEAQTKSKTPAIVIYPGGGYGNLAMDHEGAQIAAWFNRLGFTAAICVYRHRGGGNGGKGYGHPVPMLDAQRAVRTLRARADEWNIDASRVGIIGFSAGGHLASTVSTHHDPGKPGGDAIDAVSSRPDFAILGYPVISFDKPFTHRGSQRNLLGAEPDPALVKSLSNETMVNSETPPTFLFHTSEDQGVPPENSVVYYMALQAAKVPAEMHVFEKGRHGIGMGGAIPGTSTWPALCEAWLKNHQIIGETKE